ncbi:MAG TPA: hypothetical protein VFV18_04655 [Porticoccaceae bacterium]|nr:hypothetical protein [Porticoccaceae bacterium]
MNNAGAGSSPLRCTLALLVCALAIAAGCTRTVVDEYRESDRALPLARGDQIVVLGRRHDGEYETEPELIRCIGARLDNPLAVVPEQQFIDQLYPWLEPRTAPLGLTRLQRMLDDPDVGPRLRETGVRYMIWVDGSTATTDRGGTMSCAIGPGGGGCLGFATWEKTARYEAVIWDLAEVREGGRVKVDAKGSSYVIGVLAPIPIIAQVQDNACQGLGNQLREFFATGTATGAATGAATSATTSATTRTATGSAAGGAHRQPPHGRRNGTGAEPGRR